MAGPEWLRALEAAGQARARAARARAVRRLAARANAMLAGDGVQAEAGPDGVLLKGRGLRDRVRGERTPDPRLIWLAAWLAADVRGG